MLRILGRTSSINVRKVLWTCHEIGIDYQREDWGRGFQPTSSPEFLALNPHGLIPVVVDGDTALRESNTICRYLAAKHGRHDLLPQDPAGRAKVEMWMDWQATELNASWMYAFHALSRNSPDHRDPARIAASVAGWNECMAILEPQLGDHWLLGDAFTLADIVLGLSVQRWLLTPFDKPGLPGVEAYYQRLRQRPAYLAHGNLGAA
ncbi:glutathione S-transferase family protein [Chromobacterium sphagni]|uniref:Glutathione S-transferase n=1 Tax=Chromobacterium sphagni TaxID=1903179 RepID=A0A1S1WY13_9NEIS|nr:glutathione S-transferase [Chromobacterium sphagni]OHX12173.1 glutathione S-transferase [Chromobacterium sphagni]OHX21742.1 glutathione S-transferase [Chromobacterium sphagni]